MTQCLFLAITLMVLTAFASQTSLSFSADRAGDRERIRERIETLTMWKLMEFLDLDKETADKIYAIRRKFNERKEELRKSLNGDFLRLRQKLDNYQPGAADEEIKQLLESIRAKRRELTNLWENQYDEVSGVLSVRQQARLVLFLKDFQRELRSVLFRRRGQPPPPGRPPGLAPGPSQPPHPPGDWDSPDMEGLPEDR